MERKLLSLPSFFVLLLVAGIAFLAAPVVDVHATPVVGAAGEVIDPSGTAAAPTTEAAAITTAGVAQVVVIKFTQATTVKVTGAGSPATTAADGFGPEDLLVTVTNTAEGAEETGRTDNAYTLEPSKLRVTPLAAGAKVPGDGTTTAPATPTTGSKWFVVSVDVPANGTGTITVQVAAAVGSSRSFFEDSADAAFAATTTLPTSGNVVHYNTFNPAPTVTIHPLPAGTDFDDAIPATLRTEAGTAPFLVRFVIDDNDGTGPGAGFEATPTFTAANIAITGGKVNEVGLVRVNGDAADNTYWVHAYVEADKLETTPSVIIGVNKGAVTDKGGATNAAISATKSGTPTPTLADGAKEVMVDTVRPHVAIATALTPATTPHSATNRLTSIAVTFTVKDHVPTTAVPMPATTRQTALSSDGGGDAIVKAELTVTGGTIDGEVTAKASTFNAVFEATITPNADAENVTIGVKANAVRDGALNGNSMFSIDPIPTGFKPGVVTTGSGEKNPLSNNRVGFSFTVDLPDPNAANTNRHMVLAKSPRLSASNNNAGFTSAVSAIDIDDGTWVDLRHFLIGREGGSIDLIGPTGDKVRSLVISEVMWGNDNGLGTPSDSQWIELYNTTDDPIDGIWELEFRNKSKGSEMAANDVATTTAKPVVDKLSTWKKVGAAWEWRIEDTAGGSHGQSGKSTLNSATSPGSPVELVSMQRKIDYAKVEKADHGKGTDAKNREERLKGIPDGAASGGWEASKEHGDLLAYRKGTPGEKPVIRTFDKTGVPRGSVIFNEIANRSNKTHDWIELYNKSSSDKTINNWELSVVQIKEGKNTDTELFYFQPGDNGDDIVVPAKGYLLIVNTSPSHRNNRLEGGYDTQEPGNSKREGAASLRPYYVTNKLDIPDKDFLLILRNGNDKTGTHEKIEDIAGNNPAFTDETINTEVWPLRAWTVGAKDDLGQNDTKTWVRDQGKDVFHGDAWKSDGGFTGVGIDRQYDSSDGLASGTPGYANNAVQNEVKSDGLTEATPVVISEIMFAIDSAGRVPQWIELHNPSHTQAVNLNKWRLEIVNYHGDTSLRVNDYATLVLPERRIQPNQTVLIVSRETSKVSGSANFPENRVIGIWNDTELKKAMGMDNSRDAVLSSMGFHLKLSDPKKKVVDEVGNIDANQHNADEPAWTLPGGFNDDGNRSSMVRAEDTENDGEERDSWRDADQVSSSKINPDANDLYYGASDDIGTPGYTPGGVLPVQLSSFYSKRNDAGAVIITWSTESELDNAGFNILRSLSRVGEFTRINAQLIPGAGTTGEKNTYTWTDTSARPNVVYYYQIEDVSLDGEHRTLRTTRLRGYVGAAGKATTIWGELKSRD